MTQVITIRTKEAEPSKEVSANVKGGLAIHKSNLHEEYKGQIFYNVTHVRTGLNIGLCYRSAYQCARFRRKLLRLTNWDRDIKGERGYKTLAKRVGKLIDEEAMALLCAGKPDVAPVYVEITGSI